MSDSTRPRRSMSLRTPRNKKQQQQLKAETMAVDSPELLFGDSPQANQHRRQPPPPATVTDTRLNPPDVDLCSTPVNQNHHRKRNFLLDDANSPYHLYAADSPMDVSGVSQYQASPQLGLFPTMSQEMRRAGVDVVWQWNSPKRHLKDNPRTTAGDREVQPMARKRRKSFTATDASTSDGRPCLSMGGTATDKNTGFNKIREELLRAKKEDNLFMRLLDEEADKTTTTDDEEGIREKLEEVAVVDGGGATDKDATLTRKLSDEFLNDSDNDENLLIISQEMEKKVLAEEQQQQQQKSSHMNSSAKKMKKTSTSVLQSREMSFNNDSFDQYLIDIPFDELLNRKAAATESSTVGSSSSSLEETVISGNNTPWPAVVVSGGSTHISSSNSSSSGISSRKGSLNRTQSMPPDTGAPGQNTRKRTKSSTSGVSSGMASGVSGGGTSGGGVSSGRVMARHDSMPTSRNTNSRNSGDTIGVGSGVAASKFSISNPSLPGAIPMSSSTESLYSTTSSTEKTRVCSQTEIARKRQIAQERLKLKRLQQQQQTTQQQQASVRK